MLELQIHFYVILYRIEYQRYILISAQAVILGSQHFITFDKAFYDFAGECSYLLTRDFEDGNFSVILKPNEGDEPASVLVLKDDTSVEISSVRASVSIEI